MQITQLTHTHTHSHTDDLQNVINCLSQDLPFKNFIHNYLRYPSNRLRNQKPQKHNKRIFSRAFVHCPLNQPFFYFSPCKRQKTIIHLVEVTNFLGSMNTEYSYHNPEEPCDSFIPRQQTLLGWSSTCELSTSVATAHRTSSHQSLQKLHGLYKRQTQHSNVTRSVVAALGSTTKTRQHTTGSRLGCSAFVDQILFGSHCIQAWVLTRCMCVTLLLLLHL